MFEPPGTLLDGAAYASAGTPEDELAKALRLAFKASDVEVLQEAELGAELPGGAAATALLQIGRVRTCIA